MKNLLRAIGSTLLGAIGIVVFCIACVVGVLPIELVHETKSGWWLLIYVIPLFIWSILLFKAQYDEHDWWESWEATGEEASLACETPVVILEGEIEDDTPSSDPSTIDEGDLPEAIDVGGTIFILSMDHYGPMYLSEDDDMSEAIKTAMDELVGIKLEPEDTNDGQ